jgi:hypothetical protein
MSSTNRLVRNCGPNFLKNASWVPGRVSAEKPVEIQVKRGLLFQMRVNEG